MSKWSIFTLFVCAQFVSTTMFGQWAQASGQYPQSQYPAQQQPYPQSQYPETQQPQQPQQQGPANPDPADLQHGVARVSVAQGDVNVRRGDNGQLTGAVVNAPVELHDHLETSSGSRAEVQLDAVTMLRLAPNTDVGFADLQYHRAQIQLGLGTIIYRVLQVSPMQVEIDTPSVGVRASVAGEYRISVFDNGTSQISVRRGEVEILSPRGSERLGAGHSVLVRGDASNPEMQDVADPPRDQFDDWSMGRDQDVAASQSTQYVNTDVQGASDLDRYGSWVPSGYGQVWQPQGVAQDWSPYSNGQWAYTDYYGWSWIDASPWGWAPYHYGRWFYNTGYGWCWWPGSRAYPAYYNPALVSFYGFGAALAWVALAPFELFHPWWGFHAGFGFGGGFGFAGCRNAGFRGGVLTASVNSFGGVRQRFAFANHNQIVNARPITGRLPVSNMRAAMNYSNRPVAPNTRLSSAQSRSFFNGSQNRAFAGGSSAPRNFTSANGAANGWRSFGNPGTSAPRSNFQGGESSGWHSFGQPLGAGTSGSRFNSAPRPTPSYQPRYNYSAPPSFSQPNYAQPRGNYSAPRGNYSAPKESAPKGGGPPRSEKSGGGGGQPGGASHGSASHGGGGGHHR